MRFAGSVDGVSLPPLPPAETALLVAAESHVDVETSRQWRKVALELREEGVEPVEYDVVRLNERRHAGGARIDGVWAAQEHIYAMAMAEDANREVVQYQKVVGQTNSNPMLVPLGEARLRGMGNKKSLEQRRRGALAMKAMLERSRLKYVPDKQALHEQRLTQQQLSGPSRLEARAAAWIYEASGGDLNKAAATLQAAQRGKNARKAMAEGGHERLHKREEKAAQAAILKNREQGAAVRDPTLAYRTADSPPSGQVRPMSSKLPARGAAAPAAANRPSTAKR
jgi:hypothetical protein